MRAVVWLCLAGCLPSVMGCGEEIAEGGGGSTLHAVASILEVEDEIGPKVEVRLIIVSEASGAAQFVEDAEGVTLDFEGLVNPCTDNTLLKDSEGNCVLVMDRQRVRLKAPEGGQAVETFFYQIDGRRETKLEYKPGTFYQVTFTVAGERHNMFITTPSAQNNISKASEEAIDKKLELVSDTAFEAGIVEVERLVSGDTTFVSYPYNEGFLTSAQDVLNGLDQLDDATGTLITVPPEAFRREGTHRVTYLGLGAELGGSEQISEGLGAFSAIIAGQAARVEVEVR